MCCPGEVGRASFFRVRRRSFVDERTSASTEHLEIPAASFEAFAWRQRLFAKTLVTDFDCTDEVRCLAEPQLHGNGCPWLFDRVQFETLPLPQPQTSFPGLETMNPTKLDLRAGREVLVLHRLALHGRTCKEAGPLEESWALDFRWASC